jgi:hypothetical protein
MTGCFCGYLKKGERESLRNPILADFCLLCWTGRGGGGRRGEA